MDSIFDFFVKNFQYVALGAMALVAALGVFKDSILEWLRTRRTRSKRKSLEEELATLPSNTEPNAALTLQRDLAVSKIQLGDRMGTAEIREIRERISLGPSTERILVAQLAKQDPESQAFRELLALICSGRSKDVRA